MNPDVAEKYASYPQAAKDKLLQLREMIFAIAQEQQLGPVTESLKWGEPSYQCKQGSPIRMDWKPKYPQQVSLFFHCNTRLIETFREVYANTFQYLGNRELVIPLDQQLAHVELKHCLAMALRYHQVKNLPLLGA